MYCPRYDPGSSPFLPVNDSEGNLRLVEVLTTLGSNDEHTLIAEHIAHLRLPDEAHIPDSIDDLI